MSYESGYMMYPEGADMKKYSTVFLSSSLLLTLAGCSGTTSVSDAQNEDPNQLIVATYNIDAKSKPDVVAQSKQMAENDVDIVGLQEVDSETIRNPYNVAEKFTADSPYKDVHFTNCIGFQGGEYGIATVSVYPIEDESEIKLYSDEFAGEDVARELAHAYEINDPNDPSTEEVMDEVSEKDPVEPRYIQRSLIDVNGKDVAFYNTHLSYENMDLRQKQLDTLKETMDKDDAKYIIAVGDFNADQTTKEFTRFKEAYQLSNGKDGIWMDTYNGTDDQLGINDQMKVDSIDNVIVSKNIEIEDVHMLQNDLSDHNPLIVTLKLK